MMMVKKKWTASGLVCFKVLMWKNRPSDICLKLWTGITMRLEKYGNLINVSLGVDKQGVNKIEKRCKSLSA